MPSGGGAARGPGGPEGQHGCLFLRSGVVLLSPQILVPSSTGTTPSGSNVSSAGSAWCFSPRKPLFFRRRAPRPQAQTRVPPARRGASLLANPCPFVGGHHAPRHEPSFHQSDVVLHPPQTLVPSSTGTTPSGPNASSSGSAWCFSPRKPLSLRRRAPRPQAQTRVSPIRRGASLPQTLIPSSTGTTPPDTNRPSSGPAALRCWKRHRRFLLFLTKKQKAHCTVRAMRHSSQ